MLITGICGRHCLRSKAVLTLFLLCIFLLILVMSEWGRKKLPTFSRHKQYRNRFDADVVSKGQKKMQKECEINVDDQTPSFARRFPHVIIIGFGKAGTRALYQMIRMHPDVKGSSNEIRFFSNNENYQKGWKYYIDQLPPTEKHQKTIVKSPDYIIKQEAAVRLKKAIRKCGRTQEMKFIVALRDPFHRAVSEYVLYKNMINRKAPSFEAMCLNSTGSVRNCPQVNASIYSYHLDNWLKHFNLDDICFVDGDRLVKKPYPETKKLERCLGLRDFIKERHFYFNKARGFFCPVDSSGKPQCLGKSKGVPHPEIDEDIEKKFRTFFRPYNERLYKITGVNYGWT